MKKQFKLTYRVRGADEEFAPGMGAGVLLVEELSYELPERYPEALFELSLLDQVKKSMESLIVVEIEEIE